MILMTNEKTVLFLDNNIINFQRFLNFELKSGEIDVEKLEYCLGYYKNLLEYISSKNIRVNLSINLMKETGRHYEVVMDFIDYGFKIEPIRIYQDYFNSVSIYWKREYYKNTAFFHTVSIRGKLENIIDFIAKKLGIS